MTELPPVTMASLWMMRELTKALPSRNAKDRSGELQKLHAAYAKLAVDYATAVMDEIDSRSI